MNKDKPTSKEQLKAEKALSKFLLETDGREYDSAYLCEAFLSGYFTSPQREANS